MLDQSIKVETTYESWAKRATLRELYEVHTGPEECRKALNTLHFPNYNAPPCDDRLGLGERIWKACNLIYGFRSLVFPCNSFNWSVVGLPGAMHGWHHDSEGLCTVVIILSGMKWWAIGRGAKNRDKLDFFIEKPYFDSWATDGEWEIEPILLQPGTTM